MFQTTSQDTQVMLGVLGVLLITAIWGSSFAFMKASFASITPLWFLAIRFSLAAILLWLLLSKQKRRAIQVKTWRAGILVGTALAIGFALQTTGLALTSVGNAAFITGTYVVMVPLFTWFFTRRIRPIQVILGFATLIALAVLSLGENLSVAAGDLWVLASAVAYAIHFLLLEKYTQCCDTQVLTTLQISVTAFWSLVLALIFEPAPTAASFTLPVLGTLLYTAVLATAFAFFIQTAVQKVLRAATTSVLITAESLFGALAGWIILDETFSTHQWIGAAGLVACMVASVLISEKSRT